jgi:ureidoacrylate peracid hydrolase
MSTPSREAPIDPAHAALLIVDVQNYCAHPDGTSSHKLDARQRRYLFHSLGETVLPNLQLLQCTCRRAHIEVVYAAVENLDDSGRVRVLLDILGRQVAISTAANNVLPLP